MSLEKSSRDFQALAMIFKRQTGLACASVKKTGRLVVAHEAVKTGGPGAEIAQTAMEGAFDYLPAPIQRVASKDLPIPTGKLQEVVFPNAVDVENAARVVME